MKLGRLKYQSLYHHFSKFQLFWLLYIKVMYCLKYAPNGRQEHWRQTCRRHSKLSIIPTHFSFRISQILAVLYLPVKVEIKLT